MAATIELPLYPPAIPLPLAHRIDRLDSIMKILEEENNMPIDMAVKEAELKGSLMDRVRSLEDRVLKLCLEVESRRTTSKDTTSNPSKGDKCEIESEKKKAENEADEPRKDLRKKQKSVATKKKVKHSTWFYPKLMGC